MSDTIWVDVQGRSRDDVPPDNSILLKLKDRLDELSKELNVARLSDFHDYSELEAEFGEEQQEDDDARPGSWFDAEPALAAVRAIHDHLRDHPDDLNFKPDSSRTHWLGLLMKELEHCREVLEEAAKNGQSFRFLIVS